VVGFAQHAESLLHRVSGEFMILGFLAFCVWSFNQARGFNMLSDVFGPSALDILHLFEAVHMMLFIAMCLNVVMALVLIHRCVTWQVLFAVYEPAMTIENGLAEIPAFASTPPKFLLFFEEEMEPERHWRALRDYFVASFNAKDRGFRLPDDFNFAR